MIYNPCCPLCRASLLKAPSIDVNVEKAMGEVLPKQVLDTRQQEEKKSEEEDEANYLPVKIEYGNTAEGTDAPSVGGKKPRCSWCVFVRLATDQKIHPRLSRKLTLTDLIDHVDFDLNPGLKAAPIRVKNPPFTIERACNYEFEIDIIVHWKKDLQLKPETVTHHVSISSPLSCRIFVERIPLTVIKVH